MVKNKNRNKRTLTLPTNAILYLPTEKFGFGDFVVPTSLREMSDIIDLLRNQNMSRIDMELVILGISRNTIENYVREDLDLLKNSSNDADYNELLNFYGMINMFYAIEYVMLGYDIPYMGSGILTVSSLSSTEQK
jgi:hypothetical protein